VKLRDDGLAWNQDRGERTRLGAIALVIFPLFLVVAIYVSWARLPEKQREEQEALPPQLARLVIEKKEPPEPVIEEQETPEEDEPEEPEEPEPEVTAEPEPQPEPEPRKPEPTEVEKARDKARNTGILAMSSELSELSELAESVQLDKANTVTAEPIARKRSDSLADKARATTRSAGVDDSELRQQTGEVSLAQRQKTEVEQAGAIAAKVEKERQAARSTTGKQRSREDLRRTMDANKSAIYSIYARALRKQPSLQGSITPELVIEKSGVVSKCSMVESTLNEPDLERKICNRLRLVNFGSRPDLSQTTIRYPIELLPG
jgi:outer membrane biosynthesis protein TonB